MDACLDVWVRFSVRRGLAQDILTVGHLTSLSVSGKQYIYIRSLGKLVGQRFCIIAVPFWGENMVWALFWQNWLHLLTYSLCVWLSLCLSLSPWEWVDGLESNCRSLCLSVSPSLLPSCPLSNSSIRSGKILAAVIEYLSMASLHPGRVVDLWCNMQMERQWCPLFCVSATTQHPAAVGGHRPPMWTPRAQCLSPREAGPPATPLNAAVWTPPATLWM